MVFGLYSLIYCIVPQTTYASITGPKALTYFEKWFNVSFPLPKQDMIAIPDFSAGAMENWGLITYRETDLLYDEKQSSFLNKERVAEVWQDLDSLYCLLLIFQMI